MAILQVNFRSDSIMRSVNHTVFTPDQNGWNDVSPPYQTLYFLNGYSGGGLETAQFTNFALYAMMYGVAIVMMDGENSFYVDDEKRGALFSRYIGEELVEASRAVLPLSHRREDTFLGGISMGGYGALINGLRYRDTFSKIAMLSPALCMIREDDTIPQGSPYTRAEVLDLLGTWKEISGTYKDYRHALKKALTARDAMPQLFMACGKQDSLIYQSFCNVSQELQKAKARITVYEAEGGHDHAFWKKALTPAMEFITGRKV